MKMVVEFFNDKDEKTRGLTVEGGPVDIVSALAGMQREWVARAQAQAQATIEEASAESDEFPGRDELIAFAGPERILQMERYLSDHADGNYAEIERKIMRGEVLVTDMPKLVIDWFIEIMGKFIPDAPEDLIEKIRVEGIADLTKAFAEGPE